MGLYMLRRRPFFAVRTKFFPSLPLRHEYSCIPYRLLTEYCTLAYVVGILLEVNLCMKCSRQEMDMKQSLSAKIREKC